VQKFRLGINNKETLLQRLKREIRIANKAPATILDYIFFAICLAVGIYFCC
jgi:3-deoxy-D-manno-octulosonate 8-phosphate phosphatase KdsC-like HAD superfamily phosphatase